MNSRLGEALQAWRPPAPFTAEVWYPCGHADPTPLWISASQGDRDRMGRKVFFGYGPAGRPIGPGAFVVGVPRWAVVRVVKASNEDGETVYALASQILQ